MTFDLLIQHLLTDEGGFQDRPADAGNWTGGRRGEGELRGTKWGISARSYPALDIKTLTREQAREIYYRDFWKALGLDALPGPLRYPVFDMAVNAGPQRAIKLLQFLVGVKTDGVIGPRTAAAATAGAATRYTELRKIYYTMVAAQAPPSTADPRLVAFVRELIGRGSEKNKEFLAGWLRRADRVRTLSARLLTESA